MAACAVDSDVRTVGIDSTWTGTARQHPALTVGPPRLDARERAPEDHRHRHRLSRCHARGGMAEFGHDVVGVDVDADKLAA